VPVDKEAARAVAAAHGGIQLSGAGHGAKEGRAEHSLEVQIPFLQVALGHEFKVVPIVFHDFSVDNCRNLGHALAGLLDLDSTLLVASSDLYHGYSYEECTRTDDRTVECIEAMEVEEFCLGAAEGRYLACGAGPIGALLFAASEIGSARVTLAARTNSADVTGIRGGWTVGYASFCVSRASDL
jgi:AmmeMemoRadiSam system protein B